MFPSVVRELSKTRSKNIFIKIPRYDDKVIWEKAQKLQKHISYSSDVFIFGNYRFIEKKYKEVSKKLLDEHCDAFKTSKSYLQFTKRVLLYLYDHQSKQCECYKF